MKAWTMAAALAATVICWQSAGAFDYKAQRDFSYQNPSGVWMYGTRTPITTPGKKIVTLFQDPLTADCVPGFDCWRLPGDNIVGTNTTGKAFNDPSNNTVVVGNNMIQMHASTDWDTVVGFEVPADGSYRFPGHFVILDTSPNSVMTFIVRGQRNDYLYRKRLQGKGATRHDKNPRPDRAINFDFTVNDLEAGEVISFGVNADGDWRFGSTGFDAKITPLP
jgi:hypothetical protein